MLISHTLPNISPTTKESLTISIPGNLNPRYLPCTLLQNAGIACVVWFEDAIAYYGVPTIVFDLYVLVQDPAAAAELLLRNGWTYAERERKIGNATVADQQLLYALSPPPPPPPSSPSPSSSPSSSPPSLPPAHLSSRLADTVADADKGDTGKLPGPTTTILLPARNWNFALEQHCSPATSVIPPLASLLDALIDSLLDSPDGNVMLRLHIDCMIAYLYEYVPELRQDSFRLRLKEEHRRYHDEARSGSSPTGTTSFIDLHRRIRDQIRRRGRRRRRGRERR